MALEQIGKAAVTVAAAGVLVLVGMHADPQKVHADDWDNQQNLVAIGLRIAPSFINMKCKDPSLVGMELHRQCPGGLQHVPWIGSSE